MEGLIPLVYKTLKKNKTRRQYECLSSGEAAQAYNIADFFVDGPSYDHQTRTSLDWNTERRNVKMGHRRHMSVGDYSGINSSCAAAASPIQAAPKLKRFRSHRMFSCVTGA